MRRLFLVLSLAALLLPALQARSRGYSARSRPSRPHATGSSRHRAPKTKCYTCARDGKGRIARNPAAKRAFQHSHPCPVTGKTSGPCKGYVVDHINPLKRGGADDPGNMQWQTKAAAKAKDKIE